MKIWCEQLCVSGIDEPNMSGVLRSEIAHLRRRLEEAEATLMAICNGQVDAVVVDGAEGQRIYTLESADLPYQEFLEQMKEGAVSLDTRGTVLYANQFFAELIGEAHECVLGSTFEDLIAPPWRKLYQAALYGSGNVPGGQAPERVGVKLVTRTGNEIPVQLALTPVGAFDARRFVVVVTDLTERERMHELATAREAAEAASIAKDQFLAAVGHELRTPLAVMMGWTQVLLQRPEQYDPLTRKALDAIFRNAQLQGKLIEDLLDISRVVTGKLHLDLSEFDLSTLARSVVGALMPTAEAKGICLLCSFGPEVYVSGDPQRVEQVLQNLIGNAIKFTPAGGQVTVRTERCGKKARIVVEDTGRGIDSLQLARIFETFRQGDDLRLRQGGLGLGLSITRRLVELHAGRVWAESGGLGRGATFYVELPLLCTGSVDEAFPSSQRDVTLRQVRLLIVDDEDDIRETTSRILENAGAEVVQVANAAAALAWLEHEQFDLIISDLLMPGTDGYEFTREVKRRHADAPPLLAVSAMASSCAEHARTAGFSALLTKPLEAKTLTLTVHSLLAAPIDAGQMPRSAQLASGE